MIGQAKNKGGQKFSIVIPSKKNTLVEYSTWRKFNEAKTQSNKFMKGSQSLRSLLFTMSKNKKKKDGKNCHRHEQKSQRFFNTSRDFLIKGLVSKIDSSDVCKIKLKVEKDYVCLRGKLTNVRSLYDLVSNHHQPIIGFRNLPANLSLDYFLTLKDKSIEFLNGTQITLQPILKIKQNRVSLNSFDILKCIGTGGFSKVFLCRFKENGKFYAMKIIDKEFILKNKKKKIVMNQRNIMAQLQHPFLIEMKFAFQSKNSIIFVLELCPGGQLFSLVKKFRFMNQQMAKFYTIEILLGLEEVHKNHIIYRDFKPENILIDLQGHIRIADFGLAKPNLTSKKSKAYSFCGSPQYMPPQMIMKQGHSYPVDFYCLGALLYELVTGLPPFYSRNADEIYEATISKQITFPKHAKISYELKSLLRQLLCKDQNQRLGSYMGVKEVLAHPWFQKINRRSYLQKKVKPPIDFTELKDVTFAFDGTQQENSQYVEEMLQQQKQQEENEYGKVMESFFFDYRQKNRRSSCKENSIISRTDESRKSKRSVRRELSSRSKTNIKKLKLGERASYSSRCLNINNFLR